MRLKTKVITIVLLGPLLISGAYIDRDGEWAVGGEWLFFIVAALLIIIMIPEKE